MTDTFRGYRPNGTSDDRKQLDPQLHATTTTSDVKRMVRDGFFFHASGKGTGWTNGTVHSFLLVIPVGAHDVHLTHVGLHAGRGDIDIEMFEDVVVSGNGTLLNEKNANRASSVTPDMLIYRDPTVTTDGTLLFTEWMAPTEAGKGASGDGLGSDALQTEWVLLHDHNYEIKMTNNSGATIDYQYEISWYEIGYDD